MTGEWLFCKIFFLINLLYKIILYMVTNVNYYSLNLLHFYCKVLEGSCWETYMILIFLWIRRIAHNGVHLNLWGEFKLPYLSYQVSYMNKLEPSCIDTNVIDVFRSIIMLEW